MVGSFLRLVADAAQVRSDPCRVRRPVRQWRAFQVRRSRPTSPGARMKVLATMVQFHGLDAELENCFGRIAAASRQDEGFGHVVVRRHGDDAGVNDGIEEPPSAWAPIATRCCGQRAAADNAEDAFSRNHDAHRPLNLVSAAAAARMWCCQRVLLPKPPPT